MFQVFSLTKGLLFGEEIGKAIKKGYIDRRVFERLMKNPKPKKEKSSLVRFSGNRFRNGSFSATMILIAIAIVVVLNLIVSKIPSKYRELKNTIIEI